MEAVHAAAVTESMAHLTETVPTVRRSHEGVVVEDHAVDLVAAEYRHTTARGVMEGDAPDPQLHSHVVVTSAIRDDGRRRGRVPADLSRGQGGRRLLRS
jgi:hypothetical protein